MDNYFFIFFATAFTAFAVENAVFSKVLGLNKYTLFLKSPKMGILFGGVFTAFGLICSLLISCVNAVLRDSPLIAYLRAPGYFLCAAALYVAAYVCAERYQPKLFAQIKDILPVSTFNTALFGAFYVSAANSFNAFQTVGYALGTGFGYTAAVLLVYYARKCLAFSPIARSFRGLPILLLYMGLLSLALYGVIGQGLPT